MVQYKDNGPGPDVESIVAWHFCVAMFCGVSQIPGTLRRMICNVEQVPGSFRGKICDVEQVLGALQGRICNVE